MKIVLFFYVCLTYIFPKYLSNVYPKVPDYILWKYPLPKSLNGRQRDFYEIIINIYA